MLFVNPFLVLAYYFSSFSLLGVRGSLANVKAPVNLKGRILAKSGRLKNVRSVSGVILGEGRFFSIIVNNMDNSTKHIMNILSSYINCNIYLRIAGIQFCLLYTSPSPRDS